MKQIKKSRILSLVLSLALCLTLCLPAFAANESNNQGVVFSASLENATIAKSDTDQTVTVTVSGSPAFAVDSAEFDVLCPAGLSVATPTSTALTGMTWNPDTKHISWMTLGLTDVTDVTDLVTLQYTIPANTTGAFELGVSDLKLSATMAYWEQTADANVTLTVTDGTVAPSGDGYAAAVSSTDTAVEVGESIAVTVNVTKKEAEKFASSEMVFSYDKDRLTYVSVDGLSETSSSVVNDDTTGTLTIEDCGEEKNLGDAYVLHFTAKAVGQSSVALTSAAFSDKANAEKADLIPATIDPASVTSTITQTYTVTLPEETFVHGNTSISAGSDYTLSVDDYAYYTYTVTATMGGQNVAVADNKDGTFTVANVTGALVFSVSREAKKFAISFATTSGVTGFPTNVEATAGTAYSGYTLPSDDYYTYSVTSVKYTGTETAVPYSVDAGTKVLTIAGDKITAPITITIDRVHANTTVSVTGSGASDASGYATTATTGEKYTLTVVEDAKYDYTVTATLNGETVNVTKDAAGKYSIAAADVKAGTIVFTVEKTLKTTGLSVSKYLQLDGTSLWLVKNTTDKLDGSVYAYKDAPMFWSTQYSAYCCLVANATQPTVAAADLSIVTGTAVEVSGFDVNKSGKVDANDAQLIYNMVTVMYKTGFTADVTMEKFLLADVNNSGSIDMTDVTAVIYQILHP